MTHVKIDIQALGDPPCCAEFPDIQNGECLKFVILEKGTIGGKTSCAIVAKGQDGKPVFVQFTGDMFLTMAATLKGARQRFGDPWSGA